MKTSVPEKTYNRAVKQQSGGGGGGGSSEGIWAGIASFLLFEHISGGIAGCVAIVMVFLFLCSGLFVFGWVATSRVDRSPPKQVEKTKGPTDAQQATRTRQWLARAADKVETAAELPGRTLTQAEARKWMGIRNDAWRTPLRYTAKDKTTFEIRSAGKDRQMDTKDDIVVTRTIDPKQKPGKKTPDKTKPGKKPSDEKTSPGTRTRKQPKPVPKANGPPGKTP